MAEELDNLPGDAGGTRRVVSLARSLLAKGGALESTDTGETISRQHLEQALKLRIEMNAASSQLPPALTAAAATAATLANAESALNKTAGGASASNLTDLEFASLEAIIEVTGRPSMRYADGRVQMPPSDLGDNDSWRVLVATARKAINEASASVGRISVTGVAGLAEHVGTGWRAAGGLVATNRHVACLFVKNPDDPVGSWTLNAAKQPVIEFAATDQATASRRFAIAEVAFCAEEEDLDIALLTVAAGAAALPPSLPLDWRVEALGVEEAGAGGESSFKGSQIYLVGHPYRLLSSELTAAVFGAADGAKRWSPGLVTRLDAGRPLFEHDCSTLGGNSGSCVLTADLHAVVGIHAGGFDVDEATGRGRANFALPFSRLGAHRAADILRTGNL